MSNTPSSSQNIKTIYRKPNPCQKNMIVPLNGTNYIIWYIKIGCVNGRITKPDISDNTYNEWETNDKTIMSWLLNSMNHDIAGHFLFLVSAKEVWDSIREIYGKKT